ncbi:lysozyme [Bartonella tribocorum]|uniref:Lysozyme n=1 Tax=Bartonella tribocorum TaxID=85701 RepID=A0A2M6URH1_9HYPH|nr:glycoside hydrolase family protein [Bartonella tribocorum]PIT68757.1 lysozyme [Bartonella tribocorum]
MRKISKEGLALIKQVEGLRLTAYEDSGGVWTIGYGHTSAAGAPSVHKDMQITEKEAEKILFQNLREFESAVQKAVTVPLSDEQFAALVSFSYNVGITAFCNSTLLKKLNKGEYEAIPAELQKWTRVGGKRVKGLVNRRAAEAGLWAKGSHVAPNYHVVESEGVTGIYKLEALAPIIGSFSGLGGLFAGNGPVQWALAVIMVLSACTAMVYIAKRFQEHRL